MTKMSQCSKACKACQRAKGHLDINKKALVGLKIVAGVGLSGG